MYVYVYQKTDTGIFILALFIIAPNTQTYINNRIYKQMVAYA